MMMKFLLWLFGGKKFRLLPLVFGACVLTTQSLAQELFASPAEATKALVKAAKASDTSKVLAILGPGGRDIVESGDGVADENARERFVAAYEAKNGIAGEGEDKAILVIGQDDWPFPIPLVRKDGHWRFDTQSGRQEILFRRIGRNESNAIQVCLAYVDAQREYAQVDPERSGAPVYATRIASRPGKKDGLFWPTKAGEPPSPLGELAAAATREGYRPGKGRAPYQGYYYKILRTQGPDAPGGAYDYFVKGRMIGGFALVAYPADYRNSGVMTFIVSHDGVVYQKDLGLDTSQIASRMTSFNPDRTWRKAGP